VPTRRDFLTLLAGAPLVLRNLPAVAAPGGVMADPVRGDLAHAFTNPPDATRPYVLWMWMGSNISREGITRDLEAMREAGIGGATIFSLADTLIPWEGVIGKSPTPEIVTWTEPWWTMVHHAASECKRLGLELILHNCAGYESSGGTWITPELAMQEIVFSEHKVSRAEGASAPLSIVLEKAVIDPHPHSLFPLLWIPEEGKIDAPIVEARKTYYRDIAVIAMPATGEPILDTIFDLSDKMNAKGELQWDPPPGEWSIYRFGHAPTGAMIQPAQWDAVGLECDKMNVDAVTFHVEHVLGEIKKHLGDLAGTAMTTLYFDSYEAGDPSWTPKMREEFRARRGYEITPWLPVFAGRTIGSKGDTARFNADFQRTIKDLYRDCYWAVPRALAHRAGLQFVAEPYTGPWEIEEVIQFLDHANMEFWTNDGKYSPVAADPIREGAYEYDQRIMGAEAFTTAPDFARYDETPAWLKPIGDAAFCAGVNRMNLHHFVQQPWGPEYRPGNAMGQWGTHFGRLQTWWEPGKAWLRYLWRCQTMLQTGNPVPASPATSARFTTNSGTLEIQSIHRRRGAEEIYFVANVARTPGTATCVFPVSGKQPELWDANRGTMRDLSAFLQDGSTTTLELEFDAAESCFIVFRKPAAVTTRPGPNSPATKTIAEVAGPWTVHFDPAWGGPASVQFGSLDDWTKRPEPGIKYYSGTATYTTTLHLPPGSTGKTWLSLGTVKHLAEVTVNGKPLGVLWTAPWRIDITSAVTPGENRIEIAVTNVWANRLIGDEQEPPDILWQEGDPRFHSGFSMKEFPEWFLKHEPRPSRGRYTFVTWNYFTKDSALVPSGLLGPVTIVAES
jgi:hypothetical protein